MTGPCAMSVVVVLLLGVLATGSGGGCEPIDNTHREWCKTAPADDRPQSCLDRTPNPKPGSQSIMGT